MQIQAKCQVTDLLLNRLPPPLSFECTADLGYPEVYDQIEQLGKISEVLLNQVLCIIVPCSIVVHTVYYQTRYYCTIAKVARLVGEDVVLYHVPFYYVPNTIVPCSIVRLILGIHGKLFSCCKVFFHYQLFSGKDQFLI